jgi:hypothetical protein
MTNHASPAAACPVAPSRACPSAGTDQAARLRGTRDLGLLGFGDSSEHRMLDIFHEVLAIAVDDGVAMMGRG